MDAPSYLSRSVEDVLATAEEKKRKYVTAAEARRASFSPFVVTVDGALYMKPFCFCVALLRSCLQVGRRAMVKYCAGLRHSFLLQ